MDEKQRYGLPRRRRLIRRQDFQATLKNGCCARGRYVRLFAKPNGMPFCRFGVSVGKKCGKAVVRNRLKRLTREFFRLHQHSLPVGWDYVALWSATQPLDVKKMTYSKARELLLKLLSKIHKQRDEKDQNNR